MASAKIPLMAKVSNNEIPSIEVARYYLKTEFGHILDLFGRPETFNNEIDQLPDAEVWALGEALSIFYRLNSVWWVVSNPKFRWSLEQIPIKQIYLTGMGDGTPITKLIYSDKIKNNPLKLRDSLTDYYAANPEDPAHYNVRPSQMPNKFAKIIIVEHHGRLRMLDGSHRFIEQLLNNSKVIEAYVARSLDAQIAIAPTAGKGLFRLLQKLLNSAQTDRQKEAVVTVAEQLAKNSGVKNPVKQETYQRPGEENG